MAAALTVALAVGAVACIGAFIWSQRQARHPMLPLDLFRSSRLVAALIATFTMTFGIYGLLLVNSFAFQQQRGASALATALWFLPLPATYLLFIPAVNALAHRTGPRLPISGGLVLMASGLALYAAAGPQADVWLIETSFVLAGAGLALTTGPAVGLAMSAVPVQRAGLGAGVVNLARLVGITVGVAVLGSTMAAIGGADGARVATMVGALVQVTGAAAALIWARAEAPAQREEVCHA
jgi:Na+/melibiose symporter-like transporter